MCKGDDLPIDEWIRLGRLRSAVLAKPFYGRQGEVTDCCVTT